MFSLWLYVAFFSLPFAVKEITASETCSPLIAPPNGILKGFCNGAEDGDDCTLMCITNFEVKGDKRIKCITEGGVTSWATPMGTCEKITCPDLPAPTNGQRIGSCSETDVDGVCSFWCNEGFQLSGTSLATCTSDGTWDEPDRTCAKTTCPQVPVPTNGLQSGSCSASSVQGEKCQFSCNKGFKLNGATFTTCQSNGQWDQAIPSCTVSTCPNVPAPTNGVQSGSCSASSVEGGKCQFTCKEGFKLNGASFTTCQSNGQWDQSVPSCTEITCPTVSAPENGESKGSCSKASNGEKCYFTCHDRYTINGASSATCQKNGEWDSAAPQCTEDAGRLIVIPRAWWGARSARNRDYLRLPVERVLIEHTATLPCKGPTCIMLIRSLQKYHMENNRWSDIGYNFLIDNDGIIYEGRGWKIAGSMKYNNDGFGIAFIGNYSKIEANSAQKKALDALIAYGIKNKYIKSNFRLNGQRDAECTTSPGNALYEYLKTLPKFDKSLKAAKC